MQVIPVNFDAYSAESDFKDALKVGHMLAHVTRFGILPRPHGSPTWPQILAHVDILRALPRLCGSTT